MNTCRACGYDEQYRPKTEETDPPCDHTQNRAGGDTAEIAQQADTTAAFPLLPYYRQESFRYQADP